MDAFKLLPGIALLGTGAVLSRSLAHLTGVNHLLVAIVIGFLLANTTGIPKKAQAGVATYGIWLVVGIILMGVSLRLGAILKVGLIVLIVVVTTTVFTLCTAEVLARNVFRLPNRLGSLLAAGASICGVSAIVSVGGVVRAREEQIAYSAATILLFDAITIVVYPVIGSLLDLSGPVFGIWSGVSMFSTGPVVAVGFTHSKVAGQWATVAKLARNSLIGVVTTGYALNYARKGTDGAVTLGTIWDEFPKFILGFVALILLANLGFISSSQRATIENTYNWLFLLSFVGLGMEIQIDILRKTGLTPVLLVMVVFVLTSGLSLGVLIVLFS